MTLRGPKGLQREVGPIRYIYICVLCSLIWYPILSHLVSYQPRLFIAKCCCQQRWRPPACWRWMWMWHKILMSNSTQHRASNTAVPAFVTPHFFGPRTGHGIIFGAVRYARQWLCYYPCPFVISAYYFRPPSDPSEIFT